MKKRNAVWLFLSGLLVGVSLVLCIAAADQPEKPSYRPGPLQMLSFIGGTTGIFDPTTGRVYIYDANLDNCIAIREITTLGAPMRRIR